MRVRRKKPYNHKAFLSWISHFRDLRVKTKNLATLYNRIKITLLYLMTRIFLYVLRTFMLSNEILDIDLFLLFTTIFYCFYYYRFWGLNSHLKPKNYFRLNSTQLPRSNARKNKKSRRGRDKGAKRKRPQPANVAHQTAGESTAHLAPVVAAVLGASVKSSRRRNLLHTATMTIVPPEMRGALGVDPHPDVDLPRDVVLLPDVALPRDVADLPSDVDLQGGGHLHVAMDRTTGAVAAAVLHPATMIVIVVTIIGIAEVLMIAVMTEIAVDLATAVAAMIVAVVVLETAVGMTVVAAMIVAAAAGLETVAVIVEEVDLTIDAEKEEMTAVAVDLETAGIVGEAVADMVGGMITDVMNVVVVEVILKEAGVNLLLGKKAVLFKLDIFTYKQVFCASFKSIK